MEIDEVKSLRFMTMLHDVRHYAGLENVLDTTPADLLTREQQRDALAEAQLGYDGATIARRIQERMRAFEQDPVLPMAPLTEVGKEVIKDLASQGSSVLSAGLPQLFKAHMDAHGVVNPQERENMVRKQLQPEKAETLATLRAQGGHAARLQSERLLSRNTGNSRGGI